MVARLNWFQPTSDSVAGANPQSAIRHPQFFGCPSTGMTFPESRRVGPTVSDALRKASIWFAGDAIVALKSPALSRCFGYHSKKSAWTTISPSPRETYCASIRCPLSILGPWLQVDSTMRPPCCAFGVSSLRFSSQSSCEATIESTSRLQLDATRANAFICSRQARLSCG